MTLKQIKHDIINNVLRIEVLNRMLTESIEEDSLFDLIRCEDLKKFLNLHKKLVDDYQKEKSQPL